MASSASLRLTRSSSSRVVRRNDPVEPATSMTLGSRRRISKSDLLAVTTQLTIMCQSGVDLATALQSISVKCRHRGLREVFRHVANDVNGGARTSVAMEKHLDVFGHAYVASIAAGEASGTLTDVLARLCQLLKNDIRLRNSIITLLAYPLVLIAVTSAVLSALVFFVLPQFSRVFISLGRPAPYVTQLMLDAAVAMRAHGFWIACGLVVAGFGCVKAMQSRTFASYRDFFLLHGFLLKDSVRTLLVGRSFRLMGTLLDSGVPLLETIRLSRAAVKNQLFAELFDHIENDVTHGRGLSPAVTQCTFLPDGAAEMVSTAEQSGRLGAVMQAIGEHYETEGEQRLRGTVRMMEPIIIVFMGVVVGSVVLSVILPLLDVTGAPA